MNVPGLDHPGAIPGVVPQERLEHPDSGADGPVPRREVVLRIVEDGDRGEPVLDMGQGHAAAAADAAIRMAQRDSNRREAYHNVIGQCVGHAVFGAAGAGGRLFPIDVTAGALGGLGGGLVGVICGMVLGELQSGAIERGDTGAQLFQELMQGVGAVCGAVAGAAIADLSPPFDGDHTAFVALAMAVVGSVVFGSVGACLASTYCRPDA